MLASINQPWLWKYMSLLSTPPLGSSYTSPRKSVTMPHTVGDSSWPAGSSLKSHRTHARLSSLLSACLKYR